MSFVALAFLSAFFAALTSILAKLGIEKVDSRLATALRTIVVLIFAWLMVFIKVDLSSIPPISTKTMVFLILSGLSTGASWMCYFHALKMGNVNVVVPIDKSATVMAMILGMVFLAEDVTLIKIVCMIAIGLGTFLMIEKKAVTSSTDKISYVVYAFLGAIFAALTSILGKIGVSEINSDLGTAIRTIVVLIMAWVVVFISGKQGEITSVSKKSALFIALSGIATGASWLCYYRALSMGPASVVVPIDKLSILLTVAFSFFVFKEKLNLKSGLGLLLITAGTLTLLI